MIFTPPTVMQAIAGDRLFSRYSTPAGVSVVKRDGVWTTVPYPWLGEIADLQEGVGYFLGGRTYWITDAQAAELVAAGYTPTAPGYGQGPYGTTRYGS